MAGIQQILWAGVIALAFSLAMLMLVRHLHRIYCFFFIFLIFEVVRSLVLFPIPPRSNLYYWIFVTSQPISWFLYVFVVLEIYSLAFKEHRGIASLSRWVLSSCLLAAIGISALTLGADLAKPAVSFRILVLYSVIERGVVSSLLLFLLLITAFLVFFPLPVRRNLAIHTTLFSAYFLSTALALFLRNLAGYQISRAISTVLLGIDIICFALWILLLRREGETTVRAIRGRWQPEDEARMLQQLDAISSALLRHSDKN